MVLEFCCLFFRTSWAVGVLNSELFNSFHTGLSLAQFWRAFGISGGGVELPKPPLGTPLSRGMGYSTTMDFCAYKKICFGLGTRITIANDFSRYLIIPWKLINWRCNTVTYSIFMCCIQFFFLIPIN